MLLLELFLELQNLLFLVFKLFDGFGFVCLKLFDEQGIFKGGLLKGLLKGGSVLGFNL